MKKNCLQITSGAAFLIAALAGTSAKASTIVYDNTAASSYLGKFFASNNEFGDEINLAGIARTITDFKFEAFANLSTTGDDFVRFRIYSNGTGVGAAPQTLLYDSNTDAPQGILLINGINTIDVSGLSLNVPSKITWTAQFTTHGAGDTAGLNLYSPATIGAVLAGGEIGSRKDMWQNVNGTWTLFTYADGTPANFAARVSAVPEPSSIALGVLGGLALILGSAKRKA